MASLGQDFPSQSNHCHSRNYPEASIPQTPLFIYSVYVRVRVSIKQTNKQQTSLTYLIASLDASSFVKIQLYVMTVV